MKPRFTLADIPNLRTRYNADHPDEDCNLMRRRDRIRSDGYMTVADLKAVCLWKAPRASGHADKNTTGEVREITQVAFAAKCERVRIEALRLLHGVNYPTASVILHFFHREAYPIVDFRALWSLRIPQPPQYTFEFWWDYVNTCRRLFAKAQSRFPSLTLRELDRALWQYSKENQR